LTRNRKQQVLNLTLGILAALAIGIGIWPLSYRITIWFEFFVLSLIVVFLSDLAAIFVGTVIVCLFALTWIVQQSLPPMPTAPVTQQVAPSTSSNIAFRPPTFAPEHSDDVTLHYGGNYDTQTIWRLAGEGYSPIEYGGIPFTFRVEGNPVPGEECADCRVYADVTLWPEKAGMDVVHVIHNRFKVTPPDWDWNADDTALEVVDAQKFPRLQITYRTPMDITLNGLFVVGGQLLFLGNGQTIIGARPPLPPLKRIFKYPSTDYPKMRE
jgi:hypothetical protein